MQLFSAPSNLDNYAAMWSWPMFSCWCDRWVLCQGYWHARNWLLPQVTGELGSDRGVMADRVVVTASVVHADLVPVAMMLTCKGGTCVLTGITPLTEFSVPLTLTDRSIRTSNSRGHCSVA
jgi:hypothetical protein